MCIFVCVCVIKGLNVLVCVTLCVSLFMCDTVCVGYPGLIHDCVLEGVCVCVSGSSIGV